jgi:hypothetical protein
MATFNSNEVTRVYGDVGTTSGGGTIGLTTERTGDYAFAAGPNGLQVASFSYTRGGADSVAHVYNLTVLPRNAVVVGAALLTDSGYGGSGSSALTFKVDTVPIGSAIAIGTSGEGGFQSGNGAKIDGTAVGLVTLTESGHAMAASKNASGQIFYYVAD